MAQGYDRPLTRTGTPAQQRQALGYIPSRGASNGSSGGITVEGGPSAPSVSLTPIGAGAVLANLGPGDAVPQAVDYTFVKLTDTFPDLVGHGGQFVRVNLAETALEPYTPPTTTFGVGAPAAPGVTDADLYFDTTGPYVGYVWHASAWNQF